MSSYDDDMETLLGYRAALSAVINGEVPRSTPEQGVLGAAINWAAQYREEKAAMDGIPDDDLMRNGRFSTNRDTPEWERFRAAVRLRHLVMEALLEAVDALPVAEPLPGTEVPR